MNEEPEEYDIGWSNTAGKDLQKIRRYLTKNVSENVADKVIRGLFLEVDPTRKYPEIFPLERTLVKHGNFRFIKKWSYKIIYEFTGNQIIVHRVVHSKRDMKKALRSVR